MISSTKHRPVTFVLCAAGKGERFVNMGLNSPKPLLKLNGKSMIERSLESLELSHLDQLIIISQKAHGLRSKFETSRSAEWIEIEGDTRGQLATFLKAEELIRHEDIVIYNCDTYFSDKNLRTMVNSQEFDGIIPCSKEPGESWSFCKVDDQDVVTEVTEKVRISDWASVGYYYFKGKDLLINLSKIEIEQFAGKEAYVAPLYQRYLARGMKVKMTKVDSFRPFGTIEQVTNYWQLTLDEFLSQNC